MVETAATLHDPKTQTKRKKKKKKKYHYGLTVIPNPE